MKKEDIKWIAERGCQYCGQNPLSLLAYSQDGEIYMTCEVCDIMVWDWVPGYEAFDVDAACALCGGIDVVQGEDSSGYVAHCQDCGYKNARKKLKIEDWG